MTDERRYQEDEVAAIFEAAASSTTSPRRGAPSPPTGLTLAELQAIGREVGIAPERIAEAAASLERRAASAGMRRQLGMPVSVRRSVDLPRAPTDREWAVLVSELRATFHARGNESSRGDVRQWTNGNLHAYVEPTETGYRLRLGTLKGDAAPVNIVGASGIGMAVIAAVPQLFAGVAGDFTGVLAMASLGVGAFVLNAVRLPRWAREREAQMEYIADRALALIGSAPAPEGDAAG
ncbi:MAG TPA: hypothetical protein VF192_08185 [Longimicrobiales bacterium]